MGLILTILAGLVNAVMDYVLIVPCQLGIGGAAMATGLGQTIPAVTVLVFFLSPRHELHLTRFSFRVKELLQACYNGSSEMVTQFSNAVITLLFNIILMRLAGPNGVAAITILLYGQFLFQAFYLGFSIGISPVIGFQYGAGKKTELKNIYRISFLFTAIVSVFMTVAAIFLSTGIVTIFTDDPKTYEQAVTGFQLFAINFLFCGFNILSSGFFTALSNGRVSAIISFERTLVFTTISLLVLPQFLGISGAWLAVPVAEFLTLLLSIGMHWKYFFWEGKQNYFLETASS